MPRKPRAEAAGAIHHVIAKGNAGSAIVHDDVDRKMLIGRIDRAFELHDWSCWTYCVMDTHFHLVVETPIPNLGVGMRWLKASYAQDFNRRHERRGHLFGGRFYSELIAREEHLVAACIYVVLNPVRAGVADRAEQWPWSSFGAVHEHEDRVPQSLFPHRLLELLDARRDVAVSRFASAVQTALERDRFAEVKTLGQNPGVRPRGV
jgi:REP element-mobilizing transposase RayT